MQDFGFFLGRFHVLALHLPIGIVIAAVVLDWLARRPRYAALASAAPLLWGAGRDLGRAHGRARLPALRRRRVHGAVGRSASALGHDRRRVAAVAGWWLARSAAAAPARCGSRPASRCSRSSSITGHYGGNLTHGTTFLGEYAPSFLRALIGAAPRRPPVTSVAAADPYLDVVQPLLEQRCGTCHNDDKREGGFSMGSYDSTLVGGDTGRAIVPGNLEASELIYRIGLPPDDEEFMPAEGKTPLTAEQVEILRWWVGAGAPHDTTVGAIGAPGRRRAAARRAARARRRSGRGRRRRRQRHGRSRSSSPTCSPRACSCGRYRRATRGSSSA